MKLLSALFTSLLLVCLLIKPSAAFEAGKGKDKASHNKAHNAAATADSPSHAEVDDDYAIKSGNKRSSDSDGTSNSIDSVTLFIEQSLDNGANWLERGTVEINFSSASTGRAGIKFSETSFNSQDLQQLKQLARVNQFYKLRFSATSPGEASDHESAAGVMNSVPAASLFASSFHENFLFHFDIYGHLISVDYTVPLQATAQSIQSINSFSRDSVALNSKAKLSFGRTAEKPQLIRMKNSFDSAQQSTVGVGGEAGAAAGAGAGAGEKKEEEKSFLEKYWLYIIAFGVMFVVQIFNAAPPEESGAGARPAAGGARR
jgi:hypothetical protein